MFLLNLETSLNVTALSVGLIIHMLYTLQRGETHPSKKGVS